MSHHLVRVGLFAQVGRFRSVDLTRYPRGTRVVARTRRGVELGEVLGHSDDSPTPDTNSPDTNSPDNSPDANSPDAAPRILPVDGEVLRAMTAEDELLQTRFRRDRVSAIERCEELLVERGVEATLMDVEILLDGSTLFFYFLGPVSQEVESLTAELAETYDAQARLKQFAELVEQGCGPGCGTEEGGGCSDGGCSTCAVAKACSRN